MQRGDALHDQGPGKGYDPRRARGAAAFLGVCCLLLGRAIGYRRPGDETALATFLPCHSLRAAFVSARRGPERRGVLASALQYGAHKAFPGAR